MHIASNPQPEFFELLQSLGVAAGVIDWVVRVGRDPVFLPLGGFGCVLDQAGVEVVDALARKSQMDYIGRSGVSSTSVRLGYVSTPIP